MLKKGLVAAIILVVGALAGLSVPTHFSDPRAGGDITDTQRRYLIPDGEKLQVLTSYTAFVPSTDNAQDLGTSTARWRNFYLAGSINASSSVFTNATSTNFAVSSITSSSVVYTGVGGQLLGNSSTFFWDTNKLTVGSPTSTFTVMTRPGSSNGFVGVNTTTPYAPFSVNFIGTANSIETGMVFDKSVPAGGGAAGMGQSIDFVQTASGGGKSTASRLVGAGSSGFYSMRIYGGTSEVMRLTSNGAVGINVFNENVALEVKALAGLTPFSVSTSTGAELLGVDKTGNVNINGATGNGLLTIKTATGTYAINVVSSTNPGDNVFSVSSTPGATDFVWVGSQTPGTSFTNPGIQITKFVALRGDSNGGLNIVATGNSPTQAVFRLSSFQQNLFFDNRAVGGQIFRNNTDSATVQWMTVQSNGGISFITTTPPFGNLFQVATSTLNATTTITIGKPATRGTCINVYATDGTLLNITYTNAGVQTVTAGQCVI